MAKKYKYANAEGTAVNDTEKGIYGIHRGVYLWREVEEYINEGEVIEPYKTDAEKKAESLKEKTEELSRIKKKYKDEEGIIVDGVRFDTDFGARMAYVELHLKFIADPNYTVSNWKASDGQWVNMNYMTFGKMMAAWEQRLGSLFTFIKVKETEIASATYPSNVDLRYNG